MGYTRMSSGSEFKTVASVLPSVFAECIDCNL